MQALTPQSDKGSTAEEKAAAVSLPRLPATAGML